MRKNQYGLVAHFLSIFDLLLLKYTQEVAHLLITPEKNFYIEDRRDR